MARGKQNQNDSKKASKQKDQTESEKKGQTQNKAKQTTSSKDPKTNNHEKQWQDTDFNGTELTMTQLKDMIQTLAAKIYEEKFEDLQEEMIEQVEFRVTVQCEGMEETINNLKKEISDLKAERETVNTTVENLRMIMKKKDREIEKLLWENQCRAEEMENLKIKQDQLEQQKYEKNVRIVGMPDPECSVEEEKENVVRFAKETLKLKLKTTDISEVQRMGKKTDRKPSRDLIVKFKKKETRNIFYKERKKPFENGLQSRVYINEHLTSYRSNLFFAARKLVKSRKLHSAWSQHGNILIRRDESDNPKQINTHKELAPFQGNEDEDNGNSTSDEISDGDDSV